MSSLQDEKMAKVVRYTRGAVHNGIRGAIMTSLLKQVPAPSRNPMRKPLCHPERRHQAKGLCVECYNRKRYSENRESRLAAHKEWVRNNKAYKKRYDQKYWAATSQEARQRQNDRLRIYYRRVTQKVFGLYGNKCARCGFDDSRALQLDHIDGGGRRLKEERGPRLCAEILAGKHPRHKFQLLCANCNWIKRWERGEGCLKKS